MIRIKNLGSYYNFYEKHESALRARDSVSGEPT
jgi:hypothetical protein